MARRCSNKWVVKIRVARAASTVLIAVVAATMAATAAAGFESVELLEERAVHAGELAPNYNDEARLDNSRRRLQTPMRTEIGEGDGRTPTDTA